MPSVSLNTYFLVALFILQAGQPAFGVIFLHLEINQQTLH